MRLRSHLVPAAILVAIGFAFLGSTGRDDAYLTYWPAHALAATGRIVNYNGEAVEQSSSLLHVAVLAAAAKLTPWSVPALGWLVGVLGGIATVVLASRLAGRIVPGAAFLTGILVATTGSLVYWSFGGLETSLAALLLLAAIACAAASSDRPATSIHARCAIAFVLASAIRPEGGLVLVALAIGELVLALFRRARSSQDATVPLAPALRLVVLAVGGLAIVTMARYALFRDVVPEPVHAKVSGLRIEEGWQYLARWFARRPAGITLAAAAIALVLKPPRTTFERLLALGIAAQFGFVLTAGGDWMECGRLAVPGTTLAAVLVGLQISRVPQGAARIGLAGVLVAVQSWGIALTVRKDSTGQTCWSSLGTIPTSGVVRDVPWFERGNRVHARDLAILPAVLASVDAVHDRVGGRVTVASSQAGMIAYYLVRDRGSFVEFIDRGRLVSDPFCRCKEGVEHSRLGDVMPYGYWFDHVDACGLGKPDVVFELGIFAEHAALRDGYSLVYQTPPVRLGSNSTLLPGLPLYSAQFVAVRSDLASAVSGLVFPLPSGS